MSRAFPPRSGCPVPDIPAIVGNLVVSCNVSDPPAPCIRFPDILLPFPPSFDYGCYEPSVSVIVQPASVTPNLQVVLDYPKSAETSVCNPRFNFKIKFPSVPSPPPPCSDHLKVCDPFTSNSVKVGWGSGGTQITVIANAQERLDPLCAACGAPKPCKGNGHQNENSNPGCPPSGDANNNTDVGNAFCDCHCDPDDGGGPPPPGCSDSGGDPPPGCSKWFLLCPEEYDFYVPTPEAHDECDSRTNDSPCGFKCPLPVSIPDGIPFITGFGTNSDPTDIWKVVGDTLTLNYRHATYKPPCGCNTTINLLCGLTISSSGLVTGFQFSKLEFTNGVLVKTSTVGTTGSCTTCP